MKERYVSKIYQLVILIIAILLISGVMMFCACDKVDPNSREYKFSIDRFVGDYQVTQPGKGIDSGNIVVDIRVMDENGDILQLGGTITWFISISPQGYYAYDIPAVVYEPNLTKCPIKYYDYTIDPLVSKKIMEIVSMLGKSYAVTASSLILKDSDTELEYVSCGYSPLYGYEKGSVQCEFSEVLGCNVLLFLSYNGETVDKYLKIIANSTIEGSDGNTYQISVRSESVPKSN